MHSDLLFLGTNLSKFESTLFISPEERKRLGINKSTLWYQKKNLIEGKKIKLYTNVLSKIGN